MTYSKGIGAHADSDVRVTIPAGCTTFNAVIGVDDEVGANGSVTFQVLGDATSLFTSTIKRGPDAGQAISVNVAGRSQLRLVVANGGDTNEFDHADWADATLSCSGAGGNTPPVPTIATPAANFTWHVGETISFSGSATDAEDGTIGATGLDWSIVLFHCTTDGCHSHPVEDFPDRANGSMAAPDHAYPSYLEVRLTATDSDGASTVVARRIDPETVDLTFASVPSGLQVTVGSTTQTTPFTRTMIVGSRNSIGTSTPQTLGGTTYTYSSWSDGGARVHNITAPATATTYTTSFTSTSGGVQYVSDLPFTSSKNGFGPVERDRSNGEQGASDGRTLTLNGVTYAKGIGAHAASDVRVAIPAGCTTFKAVIGVDDEVGANGSVKFKVFGDATTLFTSAHQARDRCGPGHHRQRRRPQPAAPGGDDRRRHLELRPCRLGQRQADLRLRARRPARPRPRGARRARSRPRSARTARRAAGRPAGPAEARRRHRSRTASCATSRTRVQPSTRPSGR